MSKRWRALFLALVPGLGHLYLGRHWRGLLVFALFALAVNGAYFGDVVGDPATGVYVLSLCRGAALAMVAYSILHVAHLGKQFERKPVKERKDYHFKRGLTQYLGGAFDGARAEFQTVLRLDPMDVEARFHLAMTYRALGEHRKAAKAFRRCLADDLEHKWKWEAETELKKLTERK